MRCEYQHHLLCELRYQFHRFCINDISIFHETFAYLLETFQNDSFLIYLSLINCILNQYSCWSLIRLAIFVCRDWSLLKNNFNNCRIEMFNCLWFCDRVLNFPIEDSRAIFQMAKTLLTVTDVIESECVSGLVVFICQ